MRKGVNQLEQHPKKLCILNTQVSDAEFFVSDYFYWLFLVVSSIVQVVAQVMQSRVDVPVLSRPGWPPLLVQGRFLGSRWRTGFPVK
ncbi:hypothetical protein EMIT0P171_10419 [Pseudomonas sp. IT-P171]